MVEICQHIWVEFYIAILRSWIGVTPVPSFKILLIVVDKGWRVLLLIPLMGKDTSFSKRCVGLPIRTLMWRAACCSFYPTVCPGLWFWGRARCRGQDTYGTASWGSAVANGASWLVMKERGQAVAPEEKLEEKDSMLKWDGGAGGKSVALEPCQFWRCWAHRATTLSL